MNKRIYVFAIALATSVLTHAASFDCSKASSKNEKLICSSPKLGKLDEEMALAYKKLYVTYGIQMQLLQRQWLKELMPCRDEKCLIEKYEERLSDFDDLNNKISFIDTITVAKIDQNRDGLGRYDDALITSSAVQKIDKRQYAMSAGMKAIYANLIEKNIGKSFVVTYINDDEGRFSWIQMATLMRE